MWSVPEPEMTDMSNLQLLGVKQQTPLTQKIQDITFPTIVPMIGHDTNNYRNVRAAILANFRMLIFVSRVPCTRMLRAVPGNEIQHGCG